MRNYESAYHYCSAQFVFHLAITIKWVDKWQFENLKIAKPFYYWSGNFDWICALTADSLARQNKKPKLKERNEVPLEKWQNETVPFRTIHIDHKGPLHPPSNRNLHCFLVFDAFPLFLMVYPVTSTGAQATISAVEKRIHSFGIPQSLVHGRGIAFINTDFIRWTKKWASTCDLEQHTGLGLMAKVKPRINTLPATGGTSLTTPETTGLP